MADAGNKNAWRRSSQQPPKRDDSNSRNKENTASKSSKPAVPQQQREKATSPAPPPQNPWTKSAPPAAKSASGTSTPVPREKPAPPPPSSTASATAATKEDSGKNKMNTAGLAGLSEAQALPSYNRNEVEKMFADEARKNMQNLGPEGYVALESDDDTARKPGTMANGLNFWDELSKQIAELEEAKKKGISTASVPEFGHGPPRREPSPELYPLPAQKQDDTPLLRSEWQTVSRKKGGKQKISTRPPPPFDGPADNKDSNGSILTPPPSGDDDTSDQGCKQGKASGLASGPSTHSNEITVDTKDAQPVSFKITTRPPSSIMESDSSTAEVFSKSKIKRMKRQTAANNAKVAYLKGELALQKARWENQMPSQESIRNAPVPLVVAAFKGVEMSLSSESRAEAKQDLEAWLRRRNEADYEPSWLVGFCVKTVVSMDKGPVPIAPQALRDIVYKCMMEKYGALVN